ncbi:hypothetical protein Aco04nite_91760 [Winogradskya consettensis]|uniref:Uncharacterized protein n=1 Tax=Winogradskya consettensis TaxID=113560 RepID=A0A919T1R8_9ACTN|nr:hypothetical protein Aco04nite_91760 [Actinoplanes consettensis]
MQVRALGLDEATQAGEDRFRHVPVGEGSPVGVSARDDRGHPLRLRVGWYCLAEVDAGEQVGACGVREPIDGEYRR